LGFDGHGMQEPRRMNPPPPDLVERLDRLLPQTQCGQCGFDGCRPYAEAMARGEAAIDRCPPGGDAGARILARLLDVPPVPYDRSRGLHRHPQVAVVIEADCIGCTKCIQACPVDAIVGASKLMHTVVPPLCTGCELCVPACPVDCIEMQPRMDAL
jgi:electron transport complex protein RnfB